MHSRGSAAADLLHNALRNNPRCRTDDATQGTAPAFPRRAVSASRLANEAPPAAEARSSTLTLLDLVDTFYGETMQNLKAWSAAPPRLREPIEHPPVPVQLVSTAHSSQDGIEPTDKRGSSSSADVPADHHASPASVDEPHAGSGSA